MTHLFLPAVNGFTFTTTASSPKSKTKPMSSAKSGPLTSLWSPNSTPPIIHSDNRSTLAQCLELSMHDNKFSALFLFWAFFFIFIFLHFCFAWMLFFGQQAIGLQVSGYKVMWKESFSLSNLYCVWHPVMDCALWSNVSDLGSSVQRTETCRVWNVALGFFTISLRIAQSDLRVN